MASVAVSKKAFNIDIDTVQFIPLHRWEQNH